MPVAETLAAQRGWPRGTAGATPRHGRVRGVARAVASSLVFFVRLFPMLPSQPVDWLTRAPRIERLSYPTRAGRVAGDVYRPASGGPHPGVVVSLGVVPFGIEHPQVPRLGQALARSGFAALLHWSPAMRDLRLDPADTEDLAAAYDALLGQAYVDPSRSGFLGTCVGGSFALLAVAAPRIRGRVAFVVAYAPYASMWTLARDIASASRTLGNLREPWRVDPLTWKTFLRTLTAALPPDEARRLREAFGTRFARGASNAGGVGPAPVRPDAAAFSAAGRAVLRVLTADDPDAAALALRQLPAATRASLTAMSPLECVDRIEAPLVLLLHDRYDPVIPVGESRRLWSALAGRAGVRYTELGFRHLDPATLSPLRLARELPRFYRAVYPLFRQAMA